MQFREGVVALGRPVSHVVLRDLYIHHIDEFGVNVQDVDLGRLAEEFKLTGGQIVNAVLTAASLAASRLGAESDIGQITMADFEAAAQSEQNGYAEEGSNDRIGF